VQVLPQSDAQIEQLLPQPNAQIEQALPESNAEIEQLLLEPELELEPAENISNKGLDEKVDYALHKIEDLYKIINLLKSKVYYIPKLKENMLLLFFMFRSNVSLVYILNT
jgi:hypothetical protein